MQYYDYDWRPYMQMMGMPGHFNTAVTMPEQQLESMYPEIYNIVNPVVESHCDNMEMKFGKMYCPNKEQLEAITDNILSQVEPGVEAIIEKEAGSTGRQFGFGGRRILRGLIGILLIRNLLRRRQRPFGFTPGFFPGVPFGGFYGF